MYNRKNYINKLKGEKSLEKRYQVFVSSTYEDLLEERREVMNALLELDCIPSGMELFPAANESQWNLIKKVIDDCDYYILIIGGRYGSIGAEGISYTEMEYKYALSINKPIIAFLHKSPGSIIASKTEKTDSGKQQLEEFKKFVSNKHCKFWTNSSELGSAVSRSLIQLIKSNPAIGWVRANELSDREATMELLKLRKYNDELENEIRKIKFSEPSGVEDLSKGDELFTIRYTFKTEDENFLDIPWSGTFKTSWNKIYSFISPIMINEANEYTIKTSLNKFIESQNITSLEKNKKLNRKRLKNFSINDEDFQTIKIQFRALGLIKKSDKTRSIKDNSTYWALTPYGDEIMTRLRAIKTNSIN